MPLKVIPLPQFTDAAQQAGVPFAFAKETIVEKLEHSAWCGEFVVPVYGKGDFEMLPMGGFYQRSWWYETEAGRREGQSLHLYLSRVFPVYLFTFSAAPRHAVPWRLPGAIELLRDHARLIHRELVAAEVWS